MGKLLTKILLFLVLFANISLSADTIRGSKHDLSITNYYGPYAGATTEVCIFCHTPHGSNTELGRPLWNRNISDMSAFTLYNGTSGVPNNPSILCLSCHDGVSSKGDQSAVNPIDQHNLRNSPGAGHLVYSETVNCNACHFSGNTFPDQEWRVGPDLTNDHPVSVSYGDAKTKNPLTFRDAPINGLKLFNGNVECSSCHSVHDPANGRFLRVSNDNSELCQSCHQK